MPQSLLKESLCNLVNQPLTTLPKNQYIQEPRNKPISLPYIDQTIAPQNQLTLITWNIGHLYTTIPSMIGFLKKYNPAFLILQETKITSTRHTKHIERNFPGYKVFIGSTHNEHKCSIRSSLPYTPNRAGIITTIHESFYQLDYCSLPKVPFKLKAFLHFFQVHPPGFSPLLLINIYYPNHVEDTYLIPEIFEAINQTVSSLKHPDATIIIAGDFNQDILNKGRIYEGTCHHNSPIQKPWHELTRKLNIKAIPNLSEYTR